MMVRGSEAEVVVELFEESAAEEMWGRLPFEASARTMRGEVVIPVPVPGATQPGDKGEVKAGDAAYSPEENAMCLFYENGAAGETGSLSGEMLNVFGCIVEGIEACGSIRANETVRIEPVEG